MYIIVGLGNPSKQYEGTRHNAGFMTLDVLADRYNIDISEKKHKALCGKGVIEGNKVVLLKPQTFMNLSGESVRAAADFYKGEKPAGMDLADYVLGRFSKGERELLEEAFKEGAQAAVAILCDGIESAMNQFNGKKSRE